MPTAKCLHCGVVKWIQGRGLCQRCHKRPEIRAFYTLRKAFYGGHSPTLAEVEATIVEQRKKLPRWWHKLERRALEERHPSSPSRVIVDAVARRSREYR